MYARRLALLALVLPALAQAADLGIGTSVSGSGGEIYVPININDTLRVEPFGSHHRYRTAFSDAFTSVGVGLFREAAVVDRAQLYFGARASYVHDEFNPGPGPETDDGFSLSPVLGGEYFLLPQFSFAVEGYAYYTKTNQVESYGTGSQFLARFFFH